jgi:biopolymer transport protein ExbD
MSHGGSDENIEPDLTPLLDLVMQLLMFFIVNVGFIKELVSKEISLPRSVSAKPASKADAGAIFVNLKTNRNNSYTKTLPEKQAKRLHNADFVVIVHGREPMSPLEAKSWLRDRFVEAEAALGRGKVMTTIHIRADGRLELTDLFKMMSFVKAGGYKNLKIRAIVQKRS